MGLFMVDCFRNRGHQLLAGAVKKYGSIRAVARLVGINENQLGHYLKDRNPLIASRKRLAKRPVRIPFDSWDQEALPVESECAA
jgi:hypothetical protein